MMAQDFDVSNISCRLSSQQSRRYSFWLHSAPAVCLFFNYNLFWKENIFWFVFFNCKQKIVGFFSCSMLGLVTDSCIGSSEHGPTELLQGWKSAEVGFDGRLIGRWQVGQALEGAWERQVIWLRLWRQDAAYPIVFWRQIHTFTDKEKGREKIGQAIFLKKKSRIIMEDHLLKERETELEAGWSFSVTNTSKSHLMR